MSHEGRGEVSRKAREKPVTLFKLHQATKVKSVFDQKSKRRTGGAKSKVIWRQDAEIDESVRGLFPLQIKPVHVVKEYERMESTWKLRKTYKSLCLKFGSSPPPILSFERWLCRGSQSQVAVGDPVLPPKQWMDKELILELERGAISSSNAKRIVEGLTEACAVELNRLDKSNTLKYEVLVIKHRFTIDLQLLVGGKARKTILKLNHEHEKKLRKLFDLQAGKNKGLKYNDALFCLLARYRAISGHGFQAALNEAAFDVLHDILGVTTECFASPLNCHFPQFCSAFPDTDCPFSSLGSFFTAENLEGSYEANPPFISSLMTSMAEKMGQLLKQAEAKGSALSFLVIIPGWTDEPCWKALQDSNFLRDSFIVSKDDHGFCDGAQHQRQDRYRESPFDTGVFLLQTSGGFAKWPASEDFEQKLRKAMLRGIPSEMSKLRRKKQGRGNADQDGGGGVYKGKKANAHGEGVAKRRKREFRASEKQRKREKKASKEVILSGSAK